MDSYIVNTLERRLGMDLNGDGYIGGEELVVSPKDAPSNSPQNCYLGMLERVTRRDINGDGYIGRRPDVLPGYPAIYGYPSMQYAYGMRGLNVYPTMHYVGRRHL